MSAGDLSGCEWPDGLPNPYRDLQHAPPSEVIENSVFVYRGNGGDGIHLEQAAALGRVQRVWKLLGQHQTAQALALAREAAAIAPGDLEAEMTLGNVEAAAGNRVAAQSAWQMALTAARKLEPDAQVGYVPALEAKLQR